MKKVLLLLLLSTSIFAQIKISALPSATSLNSADLSILVQSGITKNFSMTTLRGFLDTAFVRIATKQYIKGKKVFTDSVTFTKDIYINKLLSFGSAGQAKMPITLYNGIGSFAFDSSSNRIIFKDKALLTDTIATYKQNNRFVGYNKFIKDLALVDTSLIFANIYTATSGVDIKGLNSYVYTSSNPTASKIYGAYLKALGSGASGGSQSYGLYSTASGSNNNYAGYFDEGIVYIKRDLFVGNAKFNVDTSGNIKKWGNKLIETIPVTDSTKVMYSNGKWKVVIPSSIDTSKNYTWTGLHTWTQDSIRINTLWYDFPSTRFVGSVPYDSLGNGILVWRHSPAFLDKASTWTGTQTFLGTNFSALGYLSLPNAAQTTSGRLWYRDFKVRYFNGSNALALVDSTTLVSGYLSKTLTNTYIFVGNGSNVATGVAMSGDATISNLGAVTVANDSHDHTGTTISGLAVADFTSPNISNWTNDSGYLTALTGVTLGTNQTLTGGKTFSSYLNFSATGTLSLPTLATTTKGDLWYKEDGTFTVGEYRGYNVNGAFSLIRDNATYSNPAWIASLSENKISFTDITTGNASTSAHGYLPKLNNSPTQFLNGQGNWATPTFTLDQTAAYSWTGLHKWTSALLTSDTTGAYFNSYTATSGADIKGLTSYVYTSSNPTANKIYGGMFNATGSGTSGGTQSYGIYAFATGSNDNYAIFADATTNNAYAGYFNNGLVYVKDNLQVGAGKFSVSTTGTLIKVDNKLASDSVNYVLMSNGTSYTPTNLLGRNNTWTGKNTLNSELKFDNELEKQFTLGATDSTWSIAGRNTFIIFMNDADVPITKLKVTFSGMTDGQLLYVMSDKDSLDDIDIVDVINKDDTTANPKLRLSKGEGALLRYRSSESRWYATGY